MTEKTVQNVVAIPAGVQARTEGSLIVMKGPKGEVQRRFAHPGVLVEQKDNTIVLSAKKQSKKEKRVINTFAAHMQNMARGVTHGFTYTLKVCAGHFPITVKVDGDKVVITNFLGEKTPRTSKIVKGTSVTVKGDVIVVESVNLEDAGQTAANIERATRIRGRDRHVFQDGCYITEKPEKQYA